MVSGALTVAAAIAFDLLIGAGDRTTAWGVTLPVWLLPLITVVVHQSLWWRQTRPTAVFIAQCGFALISLAVPLYQPVAGLLVALFWATRRYGDVWPLPTVALPLVAHSFAADLGARGQRASSVQVASVALAFALWGAVAISVWATARRLHRHQHLARRAREDAAERARIEQREDHRRIARELHDSVSGAVSGVLLQAAVADRVLAADPSRAHVALEQVSVAGRRASGELRRLMAVLREDEDDQPPGLADLPALVAAARSSGPVSLTLAAPAPVLDPAADLAAYRVVQECLTNAAKHASGAPVRVAVEETRQQVVVTVSSGFGVAAGAAGSGGRGLVGLRERIALVGGQLTAAATPEGFVVQARIPMAGR